MGTRAIYTFRDNSKDEGFHVYKHWDSYPSGAASFIEKTLTDAWPMPRFEADEFGAAFIAANKKGAGDCRLLKSGTWKDIAPGDIEYRYVVQPGRGGKKLIVYAYKVSHTWDDKTWSERLIYRGPIDRLLKVEAA